MRATFQVPEDWDRDAPIALVLPLGESGDFSHPEALVHVDGIAIAACDRHHQEIRLLDHVRDGQAHVLALHGWTGIGGLERGEPGSKLYLRQCEVVQIEQMLREFIITAQNVLGVVENLTDDHPAKGHLLNGLNAAFNRLDTREPLGDEFYASVLWAQMELQDGLRRAGEPLHVNIVATGHAHLDVAWLWQLQHTRHKASRTFHTVVHLMDQFPEFHFTQSQPQLYDFVRQDHPALFGRIQEKVYNGQWEPIGGMWVEADCNLSGPESLARQFVLGRAFFREHFGPEAESPVLWLPDVFGYAWALPQLIKQAGLDYFFTIKIGWSQYNRLPYDSFWWQGLDGTRVLTHFSTTPEPGSAYVSTYNAMASAQTAIGTWTNFQQKESQHELLMAYGFGDGGGGPTREMIENIRELHAMPGAPRMRQGSVIDFFRRLESECGDRLPVWNGELYLELHRGTYTTHSRSKRANRQAEFALHDAEFLAAYAAAIDPAYRYPIDQLRAAWQLVCLNQFHDILPGSSIGPVYVESLQQYAEVQATASRVREAAIDVIGQHLEGDVLIVNPTSFARNDLAVWPQPLPPGRALQRSDGQPVLTQSIAEGTLMDAGEIPPYNVTGLTLTPAPLSLTPQPSRQTQGKPARGLRGRGDGGEGLRATPSLLENNFLRIELNEAGDITRIYDKVNRREVLTPGAVANQYQAFEDRPLNWDAWDIDIFYDDRAWLSDPATSVKVIEAGPLRATIEIRRHILHSDYVQRLALTHNSARLDFDTTIDWREKHILLKAAFPVDVLSPVATYEIQWGNVQRPTHRNTSWDWARFETCAHKWIDLSEGGYGVSLLNDCKYGHDVHGNVMRLSLLRAPTEPDPNADEGEHHFRYSLYPHHGGWDDRTIREAYALNDALIVHMRNAEFGIPQGHFTVRNGWLGTSGSSFVACDAPNVVIETIKQSEDGNGVIVRLYESQRQRGTITLTTNFSVASAWRCNLLEENQMEVAVEENQVKLFVKPYEIVTLRLMRAIHDSFI